MGGNRSPSGAGRQEGPAAGSSGGSPLPAEGLLALALAMGARPAVRLTIRETGDEAGDVALLESIADVVRAHPGQDPFILVIVTLGGERRSFLWRVDACREMRMALSALLLARRRKG